MVTPSINLFLYSQYTLKALEDLENDAIGLESRLQLLPQGVDMQSMSATLTRTRTSLVSLHTETEAHKARIERHRRDRMKRVEGVKKYQALLIDLEHWLLETQQTIRTEIKLSSVNAVRDQIWASEVSCKIYCPLSNVFCLLFINHCLWSV